MIKRDILNHLGEKIGELEMPDDTSEAIIEQKLAKYAAAPAVPEIPDVTPRQIRQALVMSGISITAIESALNSLPEPTKSMALIEWEFSIAFQRKRPFVTAVGQLLGKSSDELDALWKLAASLQ